jgi:hypothetical protein
VTTEFLRWRTVGASDWTSANGNKPQATGQKNEKRTWQRLASDTWGTQQRLSEKSFMVDGGNKSPIGWWLTANNRNMGRDIKVLSDGTKVVVTAPSYPFGRARVSE